VDEFDPVGHLRQVVWLTRRTETVTKSEGTSKGWARPYEQKQLAKA
jgi:hypothetical protein